jgi:hypothetical protein
MGVSMPPSMAIPAFETKRSTPMPLAPPVTTATLLNVASAAGLLVIFDTISYLYRRVHFAAIRFAVVSRIEIRPQTTVLDSTQPGRRPNPSMSSPGSLRSPR